MRFEDKQFFQLVSSAGTYLDRSSKEILLRTADLKARRSFYFRKYKSYITRSCGFRPRIDVEEHLRRRIQKAGFGNKLMEDVVVSGPSYDVNLRKATVALMSMQTKSIDRSRLLKAAASVLQSFASCGKKYKPTSLKFAMTLLNKRAASGFPLIGRKGRYMAKIERMAEQMGKVNLGGVYRYFPNLCAFRLQLRGAAPNIKIKSRVMYPYPGAITAIEQRFVFPVLKRFESLKGKSFYTLGMRGEDVTKWLQSRGRRKKKRILSIDIDAWDQNLQNDILVMAFWVIRECFILTPDECVLFQNQMLHSICSFQAMKYRGKPHLFVKTHGMPSGSSWTNLVGTLCHAIISEFTEPGILAEERILLCSDDNIFETDKTLDQVAQDYLELGLTLSVIKSRVYSSWKHVSFLGYEWVDFLRNINISLALNQMVFHSQYLVDMSVFDRELARSASILLSGVNGQRVFRELFPEVIVNLLRGFNIKFHYLYGSGPPMTNPSVINKLNKDIPDSIDFSIREHLALGHLIR